MTEQEVIKPVIETKDLAFNPFRIPRTERIKSIVDDVTGQILKYEEYKKIRTRKRKAVDDKSFRRIVSAIVCDLVHNNLTTPDKPIYISRSNRNVGTKSRYDSPVMTKVLPDVLDLMAAPEMAYLDMIKGSRGAERSMNKRTTISAGARLLDSISEHDISLDDLAEDCSQETIILKTAKQSPLDSSERVDYEDTPLTLQYREDLYEINTWLMNAEIECHEEFDTSDRLLKRHFSNNSFESTGRYFGGFWQHMSKAQRKRSLYIDDDAIVALDYSQAAPKIAYGLCGLSAPNSDAYTLPSGRYNRKDIKKIFNAMLYADKPLTRFPQGTREAFERRVNFASVRDEILAYHQPIQHMFGQGIGLKLMFIESQILMTALLECKKQGIVALPVHDALIAAESNKDTVKEIMLYSFNKITNTVGVVEEE